MIRFSRRILVSRSANCSLQNSVLLMSCHRPATEEGTVCASIARTLNSNLRLASCSLQRTGYLIQHLRTSTICLKQHCVPKEPLANIKCLERSCLDCGTSAIQIKLQPFLETHINETVTYNKWENVPFVVSKKTMTRQKKTKPAAEFIAELVEEASFSKHLFDASWQGRQYDRASRDVPDGCVLVCQDFAENFKCHFQDEAQGAHWGHAQVTLHASVASYRCTFRTVHK